MPEQYQDSGQGVCGACGASYAQKRKWQRFCSQKCRYEAFDSIRERRRKEVLAEKLAEEVRKFLESRYLDKPASASKTQA